MTTGMITRSSQAGIGIPDPGLPGEDMPRKCLTEPCGFRRSLPHSHKIQLKTGVTTQSKFPGKKGNQHHLHRNENEVMKESEEITRMRMSIYALVRKSDEREQAISFFLKCTLVD